MSAILLFCIVLPHTQPSRLVRLNLSCRYRPPGAFCSTSGLNLFGTDALGRDLTFRIASGGLYSISVAMITASVAAAVGSLAGLAAGFLGGKLESIIMSIVDIQLAMPAVLIALLLIALRGPGTVNLVLAMATCGWASYARLVRSRVLPVMQESYIEAAQALGASRPRIMFKHVFPQTINLLIVLFTQQIGWFIMLESSLSYLGLGLQVPSPSWGNIAAEGRQYLAVAWWISTLPGVMLTITVSSLFLLGDGLRDRLDPRLIRLKK